MSERVTESVRGKGRTVVEGNTVQDDIDSGSQNFQKVMGMI